MKKSIFTLGLIASSFLFANATEIKNEANSINNTDPKTEKPTTKPTKVYQYSVITTNHVHNGTAYSRVEVAEDIATFTNNVNIVETEVSTIALDRDVFGKNMYAWGASSTAGYASGVSDTLAEAERMVAFVGDDSVSKTAIIERIKTVK